MKTKKVMAAVLACAGKWRKRWACALRREPVFHLDDSIRHGASILSVLHDIEQAPPPPPVTVHVTAGGPPYF